MYNDSQWPYTPTYQQALHPSQDFNFSGDAAEPTQRSYSNNQTGFPSATGSGSGYPVHSYGVVPQFSNRSRSADQVYVPGQVQRPSQHHFANTLDVGSHQQQRFQQMAAFQGSSSSQSSSMSDSQPSEASERIIAPFLSASPVPTQTTFPQVTQPSPHASSSTSLPPKAKRPRLPDVVTTDEDEPMADHKEDMKAKSRACERCRNLKVKCEFRTDTDPCKRCLNGGHTCVIPGKKKRRTPPKREHLMNEIREQADRIRDLMSQLDDANKKLRQPGGRSDVSSQSSVASPPNLCSPSPLVSAQEIGDSLLDNRTNENVTAWIAKAKESFAQFDGFLNDGSGVSKDYCFKGNPEDSSDSDDGYVGEKGDGEYEFAVVDSESEEWNASGTSHGTRQNAPRRQSSVSSNTSKVTKGSGSGKRTSVKPATLPTEAAPFGLMANLSIRRNRQRGNSDEVEGGQASVGVAGDFFFESPGVESRRQRLEQEIQMPEILSRGIITTSEAEELFKIYFDRMNLSLSLVDPALYTAQNTCYRSPFMFTVICAIASRYNTNRPGLYEQLMHQAQLAAGSALITGTKNVEMCIGYILLSLFPVPTRRWDEQRGWLYLGLAIRTAIDINLHLPNTAKPVNALHAREMLNRTRVWLNCFNLDRSTGSQYGKLPIISNMDYTANHADNWWLSSPYNMRHFDIHISCYNAELRVIGRFISQIYSDPEHPTGLNKEVDFVRITSETDEELKCLKDKWMAIIVEQTDLSDPQNHFRTGLLKLAYSYARLVVLSFGFQHAFGKNQHAENPFLMRCLLAAYDVVDVTVNELGRPEQRVYLRYGPEAQTVFVTFASTFLIKLLQPRYSEHISEEHRTHIITVVQSVIDLLGSADVAVDERHGPKVYSPFLKSLLEVTLAEKPHSRGNSRRAKSSTSPNLSTSSSYSHSQPQSQSQSPASVSTNLSTPTYDFPMQASSHLFSQSAASHEDAMQNLLTPDPEFFRPPLGFDEDILHNMQSYPSAWPMPGFDWMSNYRGNHTQ